MGHALITAVVFWLLQLIDTFLGAQALTRPIILASAMGLAAGDLKTGIIMGAQLEALYMGVSAIGGVKPSDYKSASIISTALVIYTGIDIETGLTLAAAIGVVLNSLAPLSKAINNLMQPIYNRIAETGDTKKFYRVMVAQSFFILNTLSCIGIFLCMLIGTEAVKVFMGIVPAWLLNGLNVSANVLVVVGLGLITQAIWGPMTVPFVLVGFIAAKYLSLSALSVAVLGVVIAFMYFKRSNEMNKLKTPPLTEKETVKEDGFYE